MELSVQQGVWATQRSNESKLNEAFDSAENVILIFSVNRTRHFQVGLQIKFQCVSHSLLFCSSIKLFQIHGFNLLEVLELKSPMLCQGCAKMMSRIGGSVSGGNWKYAHGSAHYGRNFSVKWLKVLFC